MSDIAVISTFPNSAWNVYAKQMLQSFAANWPGEVPLLIALDDNLLAPDVHKVLRPTDAIACGWEKDHADFVERNRGKDDPENYRMQPVRFCHKVFAIKRALDAITAAKANNEPAARYLVWMDADVITTRKVTIEDIRECLPKEGDAVSYMGRKDWDHSECGWLAFDLENEGGDVIEWVVSDYTHDHIFAREQWHDSWIWDQAFKRDGRKKTNLTPNATGNEVWHQSPMGKWSTHYKGPAAKAKLLGKQPQQQPQTRMGNMIIQTKNALPHEEIRAHIEKNQQLIKNWIKPCKPTEEEVVIVSAGPMLIAEDVRKEVEAGKRIVAVKHALVPLKRAGITPWASILLDPRPHVANFVQDADPSVIWFVASQVNPSVTMELLARGCRVFGYHAAVNAGEEALIAKQEQAIVCGGSATATRGMYVLNHLGISNFALYGYDLCVPDKPDLDAKDEQGQPKFMELSVGMNDPIYSLKRLFFTEPQLIAQFEEINSLIQSNKFNIRAYGDGIVPFIMRSKEVVEMRRKEMRDRLSGDIPMTFEEMLAA